MEVDKYILGGFMLLAFLASVLNTVYITKSNDYATEKYYRVAAAWTYLGCALLYFILYYYFQQQTTDYQVTILISVLMLLCLPAILVSVSSAFLIGGNL